MKININFTIDLNEQQEKALFEYAKARGGFGDGNKRKIFKRVLTERGTDALVKALEENRGNNEDRL